VAVGDERRGGAGVLLGGARAVEHVQGVQQPAHLLQREAERLHPSDGQQQVGVAGGVQPEPVALPLPEGFCILGDGAGP